MSAFLNAARDFGLLALRLAAGGSLLAHGLQRWIVIGPADSAAALESTGIADGSLYVWLAITFELVGGVLLLFGLATPVVGFGLLVLNVGVIFTVSAAQGFVGGWEHNALRAAAGLILMTQGSGRLGVDALFHRPSDETNSKLIGDEPEFLA